jgi:hypothetical protein
MQSSIKIQSLTQLNDSQIEHSVTDIQESGTSINSDGSGMHILDQINGKRNFSTALRQSLISARRPTD